MSRHRHPVWKVLLVMAADLIAIAGGLLFAYWFRFHSSIMDVSKGYIPENYLQALPMVAFMWLVSLRLENLYRRSSRILDFNIVRRIVTGSVLALFIFFAFAFYERRDPQYSRALIPIVFGSVVGALIFERCILHVIFATLFRSRHLGLTRTLILGGGEIAARVYQSLVEHPEHGMGPVGLLTDSTAAVDAEFTRGIPILGTLDDLDRILESYQIEEVILAQPDLDRERIPSILVQCENHTADFRIVPDTTELLFSGMVVETLNGIPFLGVRDTPLQGWNAAMKRLVDSSAAAVGMLALAPVFAVLAVLIKREDGGPVFFKQERMGLDRRKFTIWKFRSMVLDAEAETGPVFADDDDERCTQIGRVMRKYRLDEFPQLINVLRGEMSLVGPRPERPFFVEQFKGGVPRYMVRHKVKSGITGWAQIHGLCGKHGSIPQRLKYDLYYVENWSLWLDFKIIFVTLYRAFVAG